MGDHLKVLDELGAEFARLVATDARAPQRRRRVLGLGVVLAALLSGAAIAGGLLEGEPVENPPGVTFEPTRGLGVPAEGSARLTDLRVPDPDGGPPWGMRTLTTSRGFGCVQVGRIVNGKLGVLGQDGAFGNDGRFHPLPSDVLTQAFCERPDGAGRTFLAVSYRGLPASGLREGCAPRAGHSKLPTCAAGRTRVLYFGLLGPRARNVTYRSEGRTQTAATSGTTGAYLVVARPDGRRPADGQWVPTVSPGSGLASVQYAGAPRCVIRSPRALGGAKLCPRVGYVPTEAAKVRTEDVRTAVRATISGRRLTVTFRARVAGDASAFYAFGVWPHRRGRCVFGAISGAIDRDVKAGELVTETLELPGAVEPGGRPPSERCRERIDGAVVFHASGDDESRSPPMVAPPLPGMELRDPLVGRFSVPAR